MHTQRDNQSIKLQYFVEYWQDFTAIIEDKINEKNYFKNLEQDSINPILYTPKELFREFIDEIERKNLSNGDNKNFFLDNVKKLADLKLQALNFLELNLTIIKQQFSQKDDFSYLLYTLKFTLNEMADFSLGKECVKELAEILTNDTSLENSKESIKHLVNFIVFELLDKGFSHKRINKIISDIFSDYIEREDYIITDFPHDIKQLGAADKDKEQYKIDLKNFIDSLTPKDRILAIGKYFERQTISVRFIFRIAGIKGKKSIKTADIQIYNPLKTQLIDKNLSDKIYDENFGLQESQKAIRGLECNIAVRVDALSNDAESAKYKAMRRANIFLDSLMSRHFSIKTKLNLDTTKFYIINNDGKGIGYFLSISKGFTAYQNAQPIESFDADEKYLTYYETLTLQENLVDIDRRISRALTWKRKALEATNYNEAILWYWVSIENLFNYKTDTTKLIFRIAPKILAKTYIQYYFDTICKELCAKSHPLSNYNMTEETREVIENLPSNMTHKEFVAQIKIIYKKLDKDSFLYEKLNKFIVSFENKDKFKEFIEKYQIYTKQKLIFLYRIRNQITHNASNGESSTIIYYKDFAAYISTVLTCYFIDKRIEGYKDNVQIINFGEYEYNKMLLDIEKIGLEVLLKVK